MLLITGSNTGGKSVLLKTVGLLSLMALCGLPIPVNEAVIPFFDEILVDLGDEQSIEQSLSTFSSHIKRIIDILNSASKKSLVIADEIGSGTDPDEGESLAQAILIELLNKGCFTLVSTHFGGLKTFAKGNDQIAVGSVSFDHDSLKPTYHLQMGMVGQSYAFEIALKLGLNKDIINKALIIKTDKMSESEILLEKLEKEREVLLEKDENIVVCIPDMYGDLSKYNDDCKYNIRAYLSEEVRKQHYELLDMSEVYYDAYLTRPYASYLDNNTDAPRIRFDKLKKIWQDKKILVIEGEKTRMGVGNDLFDNAKDIIRILGPAEQAFSKYDEILDEATKQDKDRLVLIAMGATATVLAYDLAKLGYQALDIGHIDIEYEWMLAGKGKKTVVKHKYNNEVAGGDVVEEIQDSTYESQIIARIY